jgi:hypothetical protein
MFSLRQKREIAEAVQRILRATNHPELPKMGRLHFAPCGGRGPVVMGGH